MSLGRKKEEEERVIMSKLAASISLAGVLTIVTAVWGADEHFRGYTDKVYAQTNIMVQEQFYDLRQEHYEEIIDDLEDKRVDTTLNSREKKKLIRTERKLNTLLERRKK